MSGLFYALLFLIENPVFNAKSVELDQTPQSAASDPVLHCLPMSLLWGLGIDVLICEA